MTDQSQSPEIRPDKDCQMLDALDFQVGAVARVTGHWAIEWPDPVRILGIDKWRTGVLNITIGTLAGDEPTDGFGINDLIPEPRHRLAHTTPTAIGDSGELRLQWREGAPPKPWSDEWFIALTTYGDRVALRALPEEWTYDFKTADETYITRDKIAKWMQFPDSQYIAPDQSERDELQARIEKLQAAGEKALALMDCIEQRSSTGEWWVNATDPENAVCEVERALREARNGE